LVRCYSSRFVSNLSPVIGDLLPSNVFPLYRSLPFSFVPAYATRFLSFSLPPDFFHVHRGFFDGSPFRPTAEAICEWRSFVPRSELSLKLTLPILFLPLLFLSPLRFLLFFSLRDSRLSTVPQLYHSLRSFGVPPFLCLAGDFSAELSSLFLTERNWLTRSNAHPLCGFSWLDATVRGRCIFPSRGVIFLRCMT